MGAAKVKYLLLILVIFSGFYLIPYAEPSTWAVRSIDMLKNSNMIQDEFLDEEMFQNDITREEFADLVVRLYAQAKGINIENINGIDPFEDSDNIMVSKAFALGIIKGMNDSNTIFAPKKEIKRQEIAIMLLDLVKLLGIDTSAQIAAQFDDMNLVADWAEDAINFTVKEGILHGTGNNKVDPLMNTTREQAIVLIHRTAEKYHWVNSSPDDELIIPYGYEQLENGYLIPEETKLLISANEDSGLHLRLTAQDKEGNKDLQQKIDELFEILKINGITDEINMEFQKIIEDSWTVFNAPRIQEPEVKILENGKRIELSCDLDVRVSIYTPFLNTEEVAAVEESFEKLSTGYLVPKESKLVTRVDERRGYKLEIIMYDGMGSEETKEQLNEILSILKVNGISPTIIDIIENDLISNWDYVEDRPGIINPTWLELQNGDQLVYSSDGFVQLKIFSY